jgi:UDP-N-acetylmuramyl pentapeptide phosphotransferase/UDP-N-acetylglucosamine-1-phosphate transferase
MPWSDAAVPLAIGMGAAVVSALGASWAVGHARRHGLFDIPGERRSHRLETPRGGGIGIVLAGLGCLTAKAISDGGNPRWWLVAAGLALVAGIGWLDDHRALPAWPRLGMHVLAALLLALALHVGGAGMPSCVAGFVLASMGLRRAKRFSAGSRTR